MWDNDNLETDEERSSKLEGSTKKFNQKATMIKTKKMQIQLRDMENHQGNYFSRVKKRYFQPFQSNIKTEC